MLIAAVWVNPAAADEDAVFSNNRDATLLALRNGRDGAPSVDDVLAARARSLEPVLPRAMRSGVAGKTRWGAFVGLGHIDGPLGVRLAEAGIDLTVFDLDPRRAAPALERHARLAATAPAAAAKGADVLITMLPTPAAGSSRSCSALACWPSAAGRAGIDMSTSSPEVAERVRARGAQNDLHAVDAPVAGMATGAAAGNLEIFVGGDAADVARLARSWSASAIPERIFHVGGNGAGYVVKLMLNLLWFDQLVAIAEVLTIGARAGVDLEVLHRALVEGPASSRLLAHDLLPLLRKGEYEEGFSMALAARTCVWPPTWPGRPGCRPS